MFGTDGTKNAVHGSDSNNSADKEINLFFRKLKSQPQLNNCSCLVIKPHAIAEGHAGKSMLLGAFHDRQLGGVTGESAGENSTHGGLG